MGKVGGGQRYKGSFVYRKVSKNFYNLLGSFFKITKVGRVVFHTGAVGIGPKIASRTSAVWGPGILGPIETLLGHLAI
jgi:hypothetical protein